ncbi:MAG: methyltransferase domain-containing protein [Chitinophagaceae bacterium]
MPNFQQRSNKNELLDGGDIPFEHIAQNMRELDVINRQLGGHRITLKGVQSLLKGKRDVLHTPVHIVEIGCGGGDNLIAIKQWAAAQKIPVQLTGVDINEECVQFAKSQTRNDGIEFVVSDYKDLFFPSKPHLVFSSLFCHHFTNGQLVAQLQWMQQHALLGFFINDLHRHPLAYYSIKAITQAFSKSYLVKNDAPLSVLRGFTKREWKALLEQAHITQYQCSWQWAFRWLVTCTA